MNGLDKERLVRTYSNRTVAEIAKGFLEANGIKAVISANDAGGAYQTPYQPRSKEVRLLVSEKDVQKANEILVEYTSEILEIEKSKGRGE